MNTSQKPLTLLELIGGTTAVLEGVPLLINTPPEMALAAIAWLLLRDLDK